MKSEGIEYGKTYPADFFEKHLKVDRDSMKFGLDISEIRRELEKAGFYLSGRGQKGHQFIILQPASNRNVMASYSRQAVEALKRGVILGTNTRLDTLNAEDRRRHESALERIAVKAALISRATSIHKAIQKTNPQLLEPAA